MKLYRIALALCVVALALLSLSYLRERDRAEEVESILFLNAQAQAENAQYTEWLEANLSRYEAGKELWRDYVWRRDHRVQK